MLGDKEYIIDYDRIDMPVLNCQPTSILYTE